MIDQEQALRIVFDYETEGEDPEEKRASEDYWRKHPEEYSISLHSERFLRFDVRGHDIWMVGCNIDLGPMITVHDLIYFVDSVTGDIWELGEPRPTKPA